MASPAPTGLDEVEIPQAAIDAAAAVLSSAGPCDNVYVHVSHAVVAEVARDLLAAAAPHLIGR